MIKEILEQLELMKKECDVIVFEKRYEYWEELDDNIMSVSNYIFDEGLYQDNEERDLLFQIINDGSLLLPNDIAKLQVYFDCDEYDTNIITSGILEKENNIQLSDIKNFNGVLSFKKSFNLPDWKTLEEDYPKIHTKFSELLKEKYPKLSSYEYYEKYNEHLDKVLGYEHELCSSFIGGYLNQIYHLYNPNERKMLDLEFVMQLMTDFGNGDIVYIFRKKSAPYNFEVYLAH